MSSAVIVMPRRADAWPTAEALWITARGWAKAAEARFGSAWIATPGGILELDGQDRANGLRGGLRRPLPVPAVLRTLAKDLSLCVRQRGFRVPVEGPWSPTRVRLIWEHHDLFNRAGGRLAEATGAPWVRYVHAPQVWEARKWGVSRPLWGRALEAVERQNLRAADLVVCVSAQVRDQLHRMGVEPARTLVAPMAVDAELFSPEGGTARGELGIGPEALVIGWSGSFRRFHGLDGLLDAFLKAARNRPELHLLLVGEGPRRGALEAAVERAQACARVTFAGRVAHSEMPHVLRAMDVAVVSSDGEGGFHYSPLKLREYAACARPVVAPGEGELADLESAGFLTLHAPGSSEELTAALERVASDPELRAVQGAAARRFAGEHWTWSWQLERVLSRLEELRLRTA